MDMNKGKAEGNWGRRGKGYSLGKGKAGSTGGEGGRDHGIK